MDSVEGNTVTEKESLLNYVPKYITAASQGFGGTEGGSAEVGLKAAWMAPRPWFMCAWKASPGRALV